MDSIARYFSAHRQNLVGAFGRISRQPLGSSMTIAVIAIALALPSGLHVMVNNVRILSGSLEAAVDFTVYLDMSVDEESAQVLARDVEARPDVNRAVLIEGCYVVRIITSRIFNFRIPHTNYGMAGLVR